MADQFSLKAILSAVDNLSPVLRSVNAAAKSTRKYLGDVGSSVNNLAGKFGIPLGIVSTIAAGFGIGAIKKAVVAFADLGEEVQKGAFKAGMSNAEYQRMKYVAEQAGLGVESMQASMGKLNKNIGSAVSGKNKDLASLFRTLHIPLKDANGQMRSAADMLPQLADAFVKNKDPVKQAAIGTALFGKAYQEMLPFLNEGSDGIQKSLDRFGKLKGVISDDDLAGAKEFGDKLQDLNFVTKGFQMTIAKELVPVLSPMVEQFVQWAAVNKKLIGSEVKKVVQQLVTAVKSVDWGVFVQGVKDTAASIGGAIEFVGGLRNALIILAVIINAQTIMAFVGLGGSIARLGLVAGGSILSALTALWAVLRTGQIVMFGMSLSLGTMAVAALPFIAVAAVIAGAAYLIYRNWDVIGPMFARLWEGIKTAAMVAWNVLQFVFAWTPLGMIVNNWGAITAWLGVFWTDLSAAVTSGLALLGGLLMQWKPLQLVRDAWEPIVSFFRGVWDTIGGIVGPILGAAGKVAGAIGGMFGDKFGAAAQPQTFGLRLDGPAQARLAASVPEVARSPAVRSFGSDTSVRSLAAAAPALASNGGASALASVLPPSLALQLGAPRPLTAPATNVGGSVVVSFKDAPPGMRIEESRGTNPRVPVTTDVGYRTLGTGNAF